MNSIEKLFIPYQEALDMKLLGFEEKCFYQYIRDFDSNGELIPVVSETNYPTIRNNTEISNYSGGDCFAAPTYSQCFSWFREKYKLNSYIYFLGADYPTVDEYFTAYNYNINEDIGDNIVESYEEAELECLKQLIQICRE